MIKTIVVSGIGGVGGYFGGLLAKQYEGTDVRIIFLSRGDNAGAMRSGGLQMETAAGNFTVRPALVTTDAAEAGMADLFISCTKSYDLEENIRAASACIGKETVILPLQNGVDSTGRLQEILPENEIWEGCVYLVARLAEPGLLRETGNIRKLFFGSARGTAAKIEAAKQLFLQAGIDAMVPASITSTAWEKFVFISPLATVSSFLDKTIGETIADPEGDALIDALLSEITQLAEALRISLPPHIIPLTREKMAAIPFPTLTSMHRDFRRGGKTELESLTGYVVCQCETAGLTHSNYERLYRELKKRN